MAFSCKQLAFVGLMVAFALAYQASATLPAIPEVLLLSHQSGRFVSVASDGVVTAQADISGKLYLTNMCVV